jgi:hypothetical protein
VAFRLKKNEVASLPRKSDPYVTRDECSQISGRIRSELCVLKRALVGEDLRSGIVKDVGDIKGDIKEIKNYINDQKTRGRDWRMLGFAVLGSVISGVIFTILNYVLH